jgi:hypothetical protein
MNQTTCLMCGEPVSLCPCKTSPLTPDALEHALRSRVEELERTALDDEDKLHALMAKVHELQSRLGELQDLLRQRDEIIDTEHQQTERQKQRAIDAECRLSSCESLLRRTLDCVAIGGWRSEVEAYFAGGVEKRNLVGE